MAKRRQKGKIAEEEEVLEYLTKLLRGEATQKVLNREGQEVDSPVTQREMLRAAELMGKRYALFEEHPEEPNELVVKVEYEQEGD